jgi:CubicO group peptidase (beta-lactamase class C family)
MDSEMLVQVLDTIQQEGHDIDSVTVIRNGYVVAEAYLYPFRPDSRHVVRSCTKSVVSALVGIAIEQGYIEGVHQPVLDLFPGRSAANLDAQKQAMTLEHLLMMASGLDCQDSYLYRWRGLYQVMQSQDWVQSILDLPMAEAPGTRFEYCNSGSFLLSAIVQQATGLSALAFAQQHLFGPLGISDVEWSSNPQGISIGWSDLHLRPQDMAKIGYLYLNEGLWEGQQRLPAEWVGASTRQHIPAQTLSDGYGYQWWVDAEGFYMALGYGGQCIFVVPAQNMVVVFTSNLAERDFFVPETLLKDLIIPAAKSPTPLPANPDGVAALESRVESLANP